MKPPDGISEAETNSVMECVTNNFLQMSSEAGPDDVLCFCYIDGYTMQAIVAREKIRNAVLDGPEESICNPKQQVLQCPAPLGWRYVVICWSTGILTVILCNGIGMFRPGDEVAN